MLKIDISNGLARDIYLYQDEQYLDAKSSDSVHLWLRSLPYKPNGSSGDCHVDNCK